MRQLCCPQQGTVYTSLELTCESSICFGLTWWLTASAERGGGQVAAAPSRTGSWLRLHAVNRCNLGGSGGSPALLARHHQDARWPGDRRRAVRTWWAAARQREEVGQWGGAVPAHKLTRPVRWRRQWRRQ